MTYETCIVTSHINEDNAYNHCIDCMNISHLNKYFCIAVIWGFYTLYIFSSCYSLKQFWWIAAFKHFSVILFKHDLECHLSLETCTVWLCFSIAKNGTSLRSYIFITCQLRTMDVCKSSETTLTWLLKRNKRIYVSTCKQNLSGCLDIPIPSEVFTQKLKHTI